MRSAYASPIPVLNPSSEYFISLKNLVIESERQVLKELGFELYRITDHPHKFLLDYLKRLKTSKEVAKRAWNYVNDSYRGTLCVRYPPHVIATSCLYLAIWTTQTPMPENVWWAIFDTSIKHIMEVSGDILYLYEQPKTDLKDVKGILDNCYNVNHINQQFSIDIEEAFEKERSAKEQESATKKKAEENDRARQASHLKHKHSESRHSYRETKNYRDKRGML